MADTKISALTALAGSALAAGDAFPVVDASATATKKILASELAIGIAAQVATCIVTHDDGTKTVYQAAADTDAARGAILTSAVAALVAGDHLWIAPGGYELDRTSGTGGVTHCLRVPSNTTIEGCGYGTRLYLSASLDTATYTTIPIIDNANASDSGIMIRNLRLDGNNANVTASQQYGISLDGCTDCIIENCWIEHFGRAATSSCVAITTKNSSRIIIRGNIITDVVDGVNPAGAGSVCSHLTVIGNVVVSTNRDYAFNIVNLIDSVFSGNVVVQSTRAAFRMTGGSTQRITIANNVIDTVDTEAAIRLTNGSGHVVTGNRILNIPTAEGILVSTGTNHVVSNNYVRGCSGPGIKITGSNSTVVFNDVAGADLTETADLVNSGSDNIVYGNMQTVGTVGAAPSY